MTNLLSPLFRLMSRVRHPVSLPEDVAVALGFQCSNICSMDYLLSQLRSPSLRPTELKKLMPRKKAEALFCRACRTERFQRNTLCSFYFRRGWLEFVLQFDENSRLRRVYVQHRDIPEDRGIELALAE
jgi:hypothetical protein